MLTDMEETRTWTVDGATVVVHPDRARMARAAADQAAEVMRAAVAARGVVHAMFATGNSQLAFIAALLGDTPDVPWAQTVVFHMDEYVGVGPDHPAGFQRWIRERIVERAHPKAAYYVEGLGDPEARVPALRGPAGGHTRSTCAVSGSGRTGTSPSTIRRWPTSTTRSTSRWSSSTRPAGPSRSTRGTSPTSTRCRPGPSR